MWRRRSRFTFIFFQLLLSSKKSISCWMKSASNNLRRWNRMSSTYSILFLYVIEGKRNIIKRISDTLIRILSISSCANENCSINRKRKYYLNTSSFLCFVEYVRSLVVHVVLKRYLSIIIWSTKRETKKKTLWTVRKKNKIDFIFRTIRRSLFDLM